MSIWTSVDVGLLTWTKGPCDALFMQGPRLPTFRPTVWPAEPPDVPPVLLYDVEPAAAGRLRVLDVNRRREQVDLPPDFALRELLEAPQDDAALVDFLREWGLPVGLPTDLVIDLRTVRLALLQLQALARHVLAYRDGDEAAERAAWVQVAEATDWDPPSISQARSWFQDALNRGLRAFPVHVRFGPDDDASMSRPISNLYNAVTLQLARYLNSHEPIARCSNERCGRPFTVQRSPRRRYENSHHAAGVRYCSRTCAKAQSERDRRARRRDDEKGQDQ